MLRPALPTVMIPPSGSSRGEIGQPAGSAQPAPSLVQGGDAVPLRRAAINVTSLLRALVRHQNSRFGSRGAEAAVAVRRFWVQCAPLANAQSISRERQVPRGGGKAVVIVSLDEWNAINETLHVLGSAPNARRLLESIAQADAGLLDEHQLADPDAPTPTHAMRVRRCSGHCLGP
jgi:hypothetical protein